MSGPSREEGEVVLHGGVTNAGLVTRVGATVRRPERPTSPATNALLEHLERVGFDGAPRHLGRDERGREVLSFVDGDVPIEPYPDWALSDEALVSVAHLLRRYHEAVADFDPSPHAWPRPVPAAFRESLVCHNDPNFDNVVFSRGRAFALIDFDLAGPASAVWEVACAARLWAPLRADRDLPASLRGRSFDRLRGFVDAYGLSARDRTRLPSALRCAHEWAYEVIRDAVDDGHPPFSRFWHDGGRRRTERTASWLEANDGRIRKALNVPA